MIKMITNETKLWGIGFYSKPDEVVIFSSELNETFEDYKTRLGEKEQSCIGKMLEMDFITDKEYQLDVDGEVKTIRRQTANVDGKYIATFMEII